MARALGALSIRPPVAGTPSFRRIVQFHPPANSLFSGGQFDVAPFLWKLRSVKRVSSFRASAKSSQGNGDGETRLPEATSSNWTKPLAKFAADNFLPLALVSGVVLGLANPTLGCLADTYYLSKVSTFGIFIISGLNLRSDEIGAAAEAWPVGLFGLASILLLTPLFSKIILMLKLQPQEFVTGLAIFSCMPTTLSSGVALTRLAGGNSALALAMTVISNLLGILFIPFSISKFIAAGVGVSVPTERLLRSLVLTLLVPLILGKVARELFKGVADFADGNHKLLAVISAIFLSFVPWIQVSRSRSLLLMVKPSIFLVAVMMGALLHAALLAFNALVILGLSFISGSSKSPFAKKENASALLLVASQKTLPVLVAVVEQLGGALGESGLLVLPCVAAHLNQKSSLMEKPGTVLLFLAHVLIGCSLAIGNLKTDRDSLLALKSHIASDPMNFLKNNWTTETSVCNWIGVTCDSRHQRVTELDISDKGLVGTLPPDIGNLSFIVSMDMGGNFFHGQIPVSIFNMSSLEFLYLWNNSLSGSLPAEVCGQNGARLKELGLSLNDLHGKLPLNLDKCMQLRVINLSGNKLDGHVPRQIGNMTKLEWLYLFMNNLDGTIPEEINYLYSLSELYLGFNKLTGPIPPWIFNMSLRILNLSNNSLSGTLPIDMCSGSLNTLDLSDNMLHGEIPSNLGRCSQLAWLNMSSNKFRGELPREIGNLTELAELYIANNTLTGSIPPEIGRLNGLTDCDISKNRVSGPIPPTIGNMSNLIWLSLSANHLSGEIPGEIGNSSMMQLILHSNKLVGEIPSSICNLRSLEYLHLSNNSLEGEIPGCLGNSSKYLRVLYLKGNNFRGLVPSTFTKGCSLESLVLNGNHLVGELPKSLVNCERLEVVDIGNNGMQDLFPFWMETLNELRVLVLRSNRFNGEISLDLRTNVLFPKLQVFDISHNEFTGSLPATYFENFVAMVNAQKNATENENWFSYYDETMELVLKGMEQRLVRILNTFITIDLSNNKFNGRIPDSIGKLNSLRYLNLSHNSLTGHIPISLGNVSVLESLDLSSNELVGIIPQELTKLTFLSILNLSSNNLIGQIPQSSQFPTFENSSYMGNSRLCGSPLTRKCYEDKGVPTLGPSRESDDSGFINGFTWRSVVLGYAFGTLIGIVAGHLIFFKFGRPRWLVNFFLGSQYNPRAGIEETWD